MARSQILVGRSFRNANQILIRGSLIRLATYGGGPSAVLSDGRTRGSANQR